MTMACFSKIVASVVTYPYQVIKSRMQVGTHSHQHNAALTRWLQQRPSPYRGVTECVVRTWQREGIQGFYGGLIPNVLKVLPAAAITFVAYENIAKALRPLH